MRRIQMVFAILLGFGGCMIAGNKGTPRSYGHSPDFGEEILYLSRTIAIRRTVSYQSGSKSPHIYYALIKIYYALIKAHWAGTPEFVDYMGDVEDERYVAGITSMCWLPHQHIILGEGQKPGTGPQGFFMFHIDSERVKFFVNENEFHSALTDFGIANAKLVDSELYFRELVENFKH
jgi:hypothetical protein